MYDDKEKEFKLISGCFNQLTSRVNSVHDICYRHLRKPNKCNVPADVIVRHRQPDRGQQKGYYMKL